MIDYTNFTNKELINRILDLEDIIKCLKAEKDQAELLKFPWIGNLGHWHFNIQKNIVVCNSKKITTLNYNIDEIPATFGHEFFTDKLHPEDYERVMDNMRQHVTGKTNAYEVEYRIQTKDGKWKWFYDRGQTIKYDDSGKPLIVAGIVFDVTEQKEIELKLKEQNEKLLEVVNTDYLTKVYNSRALYEKLETEICKSKMNNEPLCILILDIDRFKQVNDTYGHLVGDKVIAKVAEIIKTTIRETDVVGRYGGEEFLLILPNCDLERGYRISELVRYNIQESEFHSNVKITISGGLKQFDDEGIEILIDSADKCLYRAKNNGRNQIVSYVN
jgi:diguanylate cyclase (GGDEF)-like protein/PAS domain S-box-containing protein